MKASPIVVGLIAMAILGGVTALALYSLKGIKDELPPMSSRPILDSELPEFPFVDQTGAKRQLSEWKGKAVFVQFIFTECADPCPIMTANFSRLQQELEDAQDIELLTVSVKPERDDPERLTKYGKRFEADFDTWTFARPKNSDTRDLIRALDVGASHHLAHHSTKTFLVGPNGRARRFYDVRFPDERVEMIRDAKRLVAGEALQ